MTDSVFSLSFLMVSSWVIFTLALRYPAASSVLPIEKPPTFWRWIGSTVRIFLTLAAMAYGLYFLFSHVNAYIMALICIGAISIIVWDIFRSIVRHTVSHPRLVIVARILLPSAALFVSAMWIIHPTWMSYDLIAGICGFAVLRMFRPTSVATVTSLMTGVVLYDLWGVYGQFTGVEPSGVIVKLATEMPFMLPNILLIPDVTDLLGTTHIGLLGLGDIVIPGILIVMAAHIGKFSQAYFGYIVGLIGALVLVHLTQAPVPATITLVPGTLFPLLFFRKDGV